MKAIVLGSAAGGGFPQWNCNCRNCCELRAGNPRFSARTQSSIAVSDGSSSWALINASPDLLTQLKTAPPLQPQDRIRQSPIRAVVLVDSQIDHTTGLAMLREGERLDVYCTRSVHDDLTSANPVLRILDYYCGVNWHEIPIEQDSQFRIRGIDGLEFKAIAVKSKAPPYSPHRNEPRADDNIALRITDLRNGKRLFYAPGLGSIEPPVWDEMMSSDCVLVDGTFWTDDEMLLVGAGRKRAIDMGHLALAGKDGMLSFLKRLPGARRILIHINNTNPILDEASAERRELDTMGIEVAYDGMPIELGVTP